MKLTLEQVEHIAKLARIELTLAEKEKLADQLSKILDYVDILGEVETKNVAPTAQITGLKNITRPDQSQDFDNKEGIINQAPSSSNNFVKVKTVLN